MRIPLIVIGALIIASPALCQDFKGEAPLPRVETDGFYRIELLPTLSPYSNADFSNIRIHDQQNTEIPYLYQKEADVYYSEKFTSYKIVEKKQEKNCCTILTLRNPDSRPINNMSLSIKNAEVTKRATLLGSDDQQNWFALKEHFAIYAIDNKSKTSEIKIVDFPLSNYTFYQLQLEDSTSAPLNIISAGYYEQQTEDGGYTEISGLRIVRSDSVKEKQTHIQLLLDATHVVDKVSFSFSGQPYFLRRASLYSKQFKNNKRGEPENFYEWIYDVEISSKQASTINLTGISTSELLISIENEDNPPLQVATAKLYQQKRYMIAWLKREKEYTLKIGKRDLASARYDIEFFKDSIPDQTPLLTAGVIKLFEEKKNEKSSTIFTNQLVIWVAIVSVVLLLGFMSIKLIREASENKKQE